MILQKIRNKLFWIIDSIRGGNVRKHLSDIASSMSLDVNVSNDHKINQILSYAAEKVPFYTTYRNKSITDFPVVDKILLRENTNQFLSVDFNDKTRIPAVTSGSTGTPFKVFHNRDKKFRNQADTIYFASLAGFEIGDKLLYMKIWSNNNKKTKLQSFAQNILPVDVISLNDSKIKDIINKLQKNSGRIGILGYSSALELVARYVDNIKSFQTGVKSIITMSEGLNEYTKERLSHFFKICAVSRYSNIENGILAQQETNYNNRFLINTASYFIEILNIHNDEHAADGSLGRIVVTDLYNKAMPLIRYDTGDLGAFSSNSRKYLEVIEGRKLDQIFDTKGHQISSYIVYKNMWQYTEILQYQLVQYGPTNYEFKINVNGNFTAESKLIAEFKEHLGNDADFKVTYVDEIPLLSSGKRKKIVNTYYTHNT